MNPSFRPEKEEGLMVHTERAVGWSISKMLPKIQGNLLQRSPLERSLFAVKVSLGSVTWHMICTVQRIIVLIGLCSPGRLAWASLCVISSSVLCHEKRNQASHGIPGWLYTGQRVRAGHRAQGCIYVVSGYSALWWSVWHSVTTLVKMRDLLHVLLV